MEKAADFLKFRRWITNKLKTDSPAQIIALSTLTGILLAKVLKRYKGRYVFDIRDYSYEHVLPFYLIEKKVIQNSFFTAISSDGFRAFLPEHDYILAHNFDREDISHNVQGTRKAATDHKIRFVWNGVIRYFEYQRQLIDALKNDDRFEMVYHGDGPELELYRAYCEENHIGNVIFTGSYDNSDKAGLLADADILNNCYGYLRNAGKKLKYAVSNKYYDGLIYAIPQVVEANGYKAELVERNGVGFEVSTADGFADALFQYYHSLNRDDFTLRCKRALQEILRDDDQYIEKIDEYIRLC